MQPRQKRCRQIQVAQTASTGLAYDFFRFLRRPQKALYNALAGDSELVLQIHDAIMQSKPAGWKTNPIKQRRVKQALLAVVSGDKERMQHIYDVVFAQDEYI